MSIEIRMPLLGDVMQEGRLVEWLKPGGGWVEKGQPLFSVETDKATFDVEAAASGRLDPRAQPGDVIAVGGIVGFLTEEPGSRAEPEVFATPAARRLARERGLTLVNVAGTGPGGRITEGDVAAYLERGAQGEAPMVQRRTQDPIVAPTVVSLRGRRRVIADRMLASLHTAPQLTIGREVDATRIVEFRTGLLESWQDAESVRPTYTDIIVRAAALALRAHPLLNAVVVGDEIHLLPAINIALAVHADEGLTVPVIQAADRLSLLDLARVARELTERARTGGVRREDLEAASFTVSSMGAYDIDWFTPIINPPQVAILGVGRIRRHPVLSDRVWAERDVVTLCLTFDHRALDGVPAARFLARVAELLQTPQALQ